MAESLGQYRLVRKLGTGGMAEVFLAAQRMGDALTRPVVIKAILPHLAEDERFVEMFLREARVAAMLSHPNIVHIHDVTRLDGRPCLVMEFLKGRDLWTVLMRLASRNEAVSPEAAAATVAQAASGLDYAHRKRDRAGQPLDLVHRDISPHNLFLTREGHVRVLDFGIAKSAYQQTRTESGVIKGKLPYMAPEQARGKDVDGRADQFALGIVLWEMVTGQRLFARDDPVLTMQAMFHEKTPKPSSVRPCPEVLERIIMKALRKSPTDRFDSCESLAHALRAWLASVDAESEARLVRKLLAHAVPPQEDEAFYASDRPQEDDAEPIPTDELHLVGVDLTPSGMERAAEREPIFPPPELTASVETRAPRRPWALAVGAVLLVCLAFGITVIAARPTAPPAAATPVVVDVEPPAPAPPPAPTPVVVRFLDVPEGVVLEVDGGRLDGDSLRVLPSDDVHHVRALVGEREVWRYDGIFRRDTEVPLPPDLALPPPPPPPEPVVEPETPPEVAPEPAPTPRRIRRRPRRRTRPRRLGMQIDLSYP
ncbi:MAG: serine/threonine protein kinase [Sandaracinus sp.]|nr:serine/threonine protein kinase [Sandaracinus sp.]